jgi:hypothetical protein
MNHPDLEEQLKELKRKKEKSLEEFRDLASQALNHADKTSDTMMIFLDDLEENSNNGGSPKVKKKRGRTSRIFKRKKRKK